MEDKDGAEQEEGIGDVAWLMGKKTMELKKKEFLLRTGTEGTLRGPPRPKKEKIFNLFLDLVFESINCKEENNKSFSRDILQKHQLSSPCYRLH